MRIYIIEYWRFSTVMQEWDNKVSQEGYTTLEAAQQYIERKPNNPTQVTPMIYETDDDNELYRIHDILINGGELE